MIIIYIKYTSQKLNKSLKKVSNQKKYRHLCIRFKILMAKLFMKAQKAKNHTASDLWHYKCNNS